MKLALLCVVVLVGSLVMEALGQQTKPIPVYPAAKLVIEQGEGSKSACCDFFTTDALEKVLSFYEKQLKTKPMDTKALAAAYPAVKQQVQMMEQQMPPGAKLRAFVLQEVIANGQKTPVLFELLGSAEGVRFSLSDEALTGNDTQFSREWREKTGKLTPEEIAQKETAANQAEADKESKERDVRRAKDMPEYTAKMTAELTKYLKQNNTELSPGLQCEDVHSYDGESSSGFVFFYASKDDFKKVCDFYAARVKASPIDNQEGAPGGWLRDESVCFWRQGEFLIGESLRLEVREISLTKESPKNTHVEVWVTSSDVVNKLRDIQQEYQSRW